jgi:flagellar biosynthesis protein FlhG
MTRRSSPPTDQADGLRRMFASSRAVLVPVVANPHVEHHGAVLARLAAVFAEQGLNTLVVDAADTAPEPGELAFIDLAACVEPLAPQLAYLAARGLPMQHVDTRGSCASFIPRVTSVVADIDVVVLHAEARVLARMLGHRESRPVLLAGSEGESITHAYAALKLLVQRLQVMSFDLVTPTMRGRGPTPAQVARRVADCADRFLGAALHDCAAIDPDLASGAPAGADLMRLACAQLALAEGDADGIPTLTQALVDLPAAMPMATMAAAHPASAGMPPARASAAHPHDVDHDALHAAAQSLRTSDVLDAEPAWISAPATALSSLLYA